jgi:uncharacterized protein (TIGR04255 family)
MADETEVLCVPASPRVRFERNTIRQTICQLRFPTLPEFETEAPTEFVHAIRKAFPSYVRGVNLQVGVSDGAIEQTPHVTHTFQSQPPGWSVALKTDYVALDTREYQDFEDFGARLSSVVNSLVPHLDTNYFTRVGLRYINVLPVAGNDIDGWVNPKLLGPLQEGVLGMVSHWTEAGGPTPHGSYSFRYGTAKTEGERERYVLDMDFYKEAVKVAEVDPLLAEFNRMNYDLYRWSIGEKTVAHLGPATPKK